MVDQRSALNPVLEHHVVNSLGWRALRPLQAAAIDPIASGEDALLVAPTAGGKTEAAVLPLLSRMLSEQWRGLAVLYVSPLRALLNNLAPRLERYAELVGRRVDVWHGDVGQSIRRRLLAEPPDLLLTTPESMESMLMSRNVEHAGLFRDLRAVVVDEVHAFASDDRGWHLLAVLERVSRIAGRDLQRIGLSASIGNPDAVLEWLTPAGGSRRVVTAATAAGEEAPSEVTVDYVGSLANAATVIAALHHGEKRLVFCDSRSKVEELATLLREAGIETYVSHSSLSPDERHGAETAFAEARNCVIVSTSTLELGVDVGDLDRVIQIDAPFSVASFLQRLGRTGRRPGALRNCLFLATDEPSLLRAVGLVQLWQAGFVEPVVPPPRPLHILAQQLLALSLQDGAVGRRGWADWIGRLKPFNPDDPDVQRILASMLDNGLLYDEDGLLSVGPGGEASYGRRSFIELTSVFTSDPELRVRHGRTDLGTVSPASLAVRRKDEVPVLLLGGRRWKVRHVDWTRRVVHVEETTVGGHSRWIGDARALPVELCRAIRDALTGSGDVEGCSRRATERLALLRDDFAWLPRAGTVLRQDDEGDLRWWTFAGLGANRIIEAWLGPLVSDRRRADNFSVPFAPGVGSVAALDAIRELPGKEIPVDAVPDDALDGLKFSRALPRDIAASVLAARIFDLDAAQATLSEEIVTAT